MIKLYGSIGYVLLKYENKYVIIFSDMHSTLKKCNNQISISKWFQTKFNTSHILLEEVPRNNNFKLKELWPNSEHTQELKKLFLEHKEKIKPIDIRPYLIPFSWETINYSNDYNNITLRQYLQDIDLFFTLKHEYLQKILDIYNYDKLYNTQSGKHFIKLKKKFFLFLYNYKKILDLYLPDILNNHEIVFEHINNLLNNIMEWYICACIVNCNSSHIVHTGLFHAEKVSKLLVRYYKYTNVSSYGVNNLNEEQNIIDGCVELTNKNANKF
jgi:hypothetical protein